MNSTYPRDVVILAGDESLLGQPSSVEDLDRWQAGLSDVAEWLEGGWTPVLDAAAGYRGPEMALADLYAAESARPFGLLKLAVPNSSLTLDWHGQHTGHLLDDLIAQIQALMVDGPVRVRGFVWCQNAADVADNRKARVYATWLDRMIEKLRAAVGIPDLPVLTVIPAFGAPETAAKKSLRQALSIGGDHRYPVAAHDLPTSGGALSREGLTRLGRRLGHALLSLEGAVAGADRVRRWIWNDARYQVWIEGQTLDADTALVTFPFVSKGDGFLEPGFAQRLAVSQGWTSVHLRASRNDWFQSDSFQDIAMAIRTALPEGARVVTYGSSMGGFGALLFSGPLLAERVIAIAPQATIDRADVPFETRWARAAADIGPFQHHLRDHMRADIQKIIAFDPLSPDAGHAALIPADSGIEHLRLPFAAHHVGEYLGETNAREILMQDLLGRGPRPRAVLKRVRSNRHRSRFYWQGRADALVARGHPGAPEAIAQLEKLGGTDRKIRMLTETLAARKDAAKAE